MSETVASLRHKIGIANDLESVVRTMKAMAASNIGQYENAVHALNDYYRTVQLGLAECLRQISAPAAEIRVAQKTAAAIGVIVFGSDQGLVGHFNEIMVEYAVQALEKVQGEKVVWAVGVRMQSRLAETSLLPVSDFSLPNSIGAITPLVGRILIELEEQREQGLIDQVYVFHNRPGTASIYNPVSQRLLPLDETWQHKLVGISWPTLNLPQVMNNTDRTLRALVREYLFVTLFRACAESLASENASRLAAMQRADKNIEELLGDLNVTYHRLRQSGIDEELFDVISGYEALNDPGIHMAR